MLDEFVIIQKLLASILVGYLLGSIPFAYVAGRFRGVDIFSTGSRTAGAANVYWNIGRRTGTGVFVGDVVKGSAAVVIAQLLDVSGPLLLLAGTAAVMGHWKSVFSGFRGGDGMASLIGVALALAPSLAILGMAVGMAVVLLLWRSAYRSGWGIFACFVVMLVLSQYYQMDRNLVLGLSSLASLVLLRSVMTRRHRARAPEEELIEELIVEGEGGLVEDLEPQPESEIGRAAPENP